MGDWIEWLLDGLVVALQSVVDVLAFIASEVLKWVVALADWFFVVLLEIVMDVFQFARERLRVADWLGENLEALAAAVGDAMGALPGDLVAFIRWALPLDESLAILAAAIVGWATIQLLRHLLGFLPVNAG